ncbi:uncharacterized protein [Lolium perenne]|uniref:uncharacterized protein n=1 Tax=Lolium perenne TaxID=4522 RepID=UPI0021F67F4C|nr:protein CYSTEINE-RICH TRANSMEMBRANE MODULE 9-like [Lolium perenne]
MSYFNQQQAPVTAYPPPQANYVVVAPPAGKTAYLPTAPPPPPGYPGNYDVAMGAPQPAKTQSRGDKGFLEGCCAAICCCCLLDMCF